MNNGAIWLEGQGIQLSKLGVKVANLIDRLYAGIYHADDLMKKADWSHENCISFSVSDRAGRFSTYDGDMLTRLVFLAHEMDVRVTIEAATHGYLKLSFCKISIDYFFSDRHPTLDEAISRNNQRDFAKEGSEVNHE